MLGGMIMTMRNVAVEKVVFSLNGREISLTKSLVDKYTDIVCPITEHILNTLIKVFGKGCNDTILSAKIESDMEQELKEYGL